MPVVFGEPIWGTVESAARDKGFSDDDIAAFVRELTTLHVQRKIT